MTKSLGVLKIIIENLFFIDKTRPRGWLDRLTADARYMEATEVSWYYAENPLILARAPDTTSVRLSPQGVEKEVLYRTFHSAKRQGNFDNKALATGEDLLHSRRHKTTA